MTKITKKPVKITETILRDAHQSLIATRMTTEQMLPIVEKMDQIGYHSVECWGGATFDASLRFLKEDPWERLRKFRDGFKKTKLQMLFRGQNILGYRPYADDVVEYFVQKSIANGIDIIRIFDCFNDLRNLKCAVSAAVKEKGHAQVALSYTIGADRGYGRAFHLHQGYGGTASALQGDRAGGGAEGRHGSAHSASHALYVRRRLHDVLKSRGSRRGCD